MFNMKNLKNLKKLKNLDSDDMLEMIGLQSRRGTADWLLPALGAFGVGMLVGAGVGLLIAPKPGGELREDLRNRLQGVTDHASQTLTKATAAVEKATPSRAF